MSYLKAQDTISGKEGKAVATIDGNVEDMFYIKKIEANVEKTKSEIKTLGRRGTQHKATGWSGTGSMTIYYITTNFRKLMTSYMQNGVDTYFDILVTNEDPASDAGSQTIVLEGVNLDKVIMAKLDTESDILDEEVSFTFENVRVLDSLKEPALG